MDQKTREIYEANAQRVGERSQAQPHRTDAGAGRALVRSERRSRLRARLARRSAAAAGRRTRRRARDAAARRRERAGSALRVQADLEALPFRRGALATAWARNSYVHLPRTSIPAALAGPSPLARGRCSGDGAWFSSANARAATSSSATTSPIASSRNGISTSCSTSSSAPASTWTATTSTARPEYEVHARLTRARTLPDLVGPDMRLLVVRPQSEPVRGRRRCRLRPTRQPVLARRARGRHRVTRPRSVACVPRPRRRLHRSREASDGRRRRAHEGRVRGGYARVERLVAMAAARGGGVRRPRRLASGGGSARPTRAAARAASAAALRT